VNCKNITNIKFGKLSPILRTGTAKCGSALWLCFCECGGSTISSIKSLQATKSTISCGCNFYNTAKEHKNEVFGRWTVLGEHKRVRQPNGATVVHHLCQCSCGTKRYVSGTSLRFGTSKSCGCSKKDVGRKRIADITNERFGRLVAMFITKPPTGGKCAVWRCVCDCGRYANVSLSSLRRKGGARSCGCSVAETLARSNLLKRKYPASSYDQQPNAGKRYRMLLADSYIKTLLLASNPHFKRGDIPQELVEVKRYVVKIKRELSNEKHRRIEK